jgi:hypothetical protein
MHYRTSFQARILSGIVTLLFTGLTLRGATYTAASAKVSDIQSKIDFARDGDTINVPAGEARWTTELLITKNVTLRGAGIGKTVIVDAVPRGPQSHTFRIILAKDLPSRVTGFEFQGDSNVTADNGGGIVYLRGMEGITGSFRLDHCKFSGLHGLPLVLRDLIGVMDHCEVDSGNSQGLQIYHYTWGGGDFGHGSWADYPYWGSAKFFFVEDCSFSSAGRAAIDCYEGTRIVVRHNTFDEAQVTAHGTEGQGRGTKELEIYNNVFTLTTRRGAAQVRSGSVVVHDNTYINYADGISLQAYRQIVTRGTWGISSGSNVWDVNNSVMAALATGTHDGSNGSRGLYDSTKHWTNGQWNSKALEGGFSYIIKNTTQKLQSVITTSSVHTIRYFQYTPPMRFNKGDRYEIWKVITTLDQPGQGKSDFLHGLPAFPKRWPHNVLEPCYSWNNKDENGNELDLHAAEGSILEGRDFFNRTPKPSYAPYIYPHPLTAAP